MSESHGTPSAVRQRRPESPAKVMTPAALALLFSGCIPAGWECLRSKDCGQGEACVHWQPGHEEETRYCARTCAVELDRCDTGERCECPDSPAKQRCFDDDGNRIGVCTP